MTREPERSDAAKRADQVVTEFTEWALKYQKMGYPSLWRKRLVDLVAAAVAEAVREPRTVSERRDALFTARAEVQSLRKVLKERDARLAEAREAIVVLAGGYVVIAGILLSITPRWPE